MGRNAVTPPRPNFPQIGDWQQRAADWKTAHPEAVQRFQDKAADFQANHPNFPRPFQDPRPAPMPSPRPPRAFPGGGHTGGVFPGGGNTGGDWPGREGRPTFPSVMSTRGNRFGNNG